MEQVRSFIAIELPDEVKSALTRIQAQLKTGQQPSAKWVDPYSIHLTLKFLGNVAVAKTDAITGAIEAAAGEISPFTLELKGLGAFPNLRRVKVVWIGVGGELAPLSQLHQRIESNLSTLGFAPESRQFSPHLTLARIREQASPDQRQNFGQLIASTRLEATCRFTVNSISLMRSQLTSAGPIYHRTSSVRMKKPLSKITD